MKIKLELEKDEFLEKIEKIIKEWKKINESSCSKSFNDKEKIKLITEFVFPQINFGIYSGTTIKGETVTGFLTQPKHGEYKNKYFISNDSGSPLAFEVIPATLKRN